MPGTVKLNESDVQKQCCDFLRHRGWRIVRTQFAFAPGTMSTGEPGMADVLAIYPLTNEHNYAVILGTWIEFKSPRANLACRCAPGKKCRLCRQKEWQTRERARGFVVWSGVDDFEWFEEQYAAKFGWLHTGDQEQGIGAA